LLIRAHFRCRRTGQDKEIDERLTAVENERRKAAQRKDEINATLARLDNIIATWDAVFKQTRDRLEASRISKAAELALFGNATKALKDAVEVVQVWQSCGE
jgi:septal ring factor EnvC (AmiA/AmiB activator)